MQPLANRRWLKEELTAFALSSAACKALPLGSPASPPAPGDPSVWGGGLFILCLAGRPAAEVGGAVVVDEDCAGCEGVEPRVCPLPGGLDGSEKQLPIFITS